MPIPVQPTHVDTSSFVDLDNLPSMDSLMGEDTASNFAQGTMVQGKVVGKTDSAVLVDIGYKAEGMIPKDEFNDFDGIEIGQDVDVYIDMLEDEYDNMPMLSARKAELQKAWDNIVDNYEEGGIIKGTMRRRVKGGLIVDVGVDAFLPGSQVDVGPVRNLEDFLGKTEDFKILKINAERRNIVVSRREIIAEARAEQRAALMENLDVGQVRKGVVKNITDFGAFIDLNGLDGLLHITDMSWGRISHPSEVVKVGEEIEVMVLDVDTERQRVSLGLKQREGNPWDDVDIKFPINGRIHGRVVNVMPYGAFVELEQGVEGLIHVSEMSWTRRVTKASDVLSVGDEVDAVVLDVQKDNRKISLGLRQTQENPWEVLAEKFPKGAKIKGEVRNMTSYGAFVQIQDEIDGMIHVSDMSWTRKINHPSEMLEKGQEVEAVVLDIDPSQQRISLGLKQLADDPWSSIENHFNVGDAVEGKVTKVTSFGAFVELRDDIEGLLHISQLSDEHVKRVKDVINVGDTVNARVVKIDVEERRIGLSLKTGADDYDGADFGSVDTNLRPGDEIVDFGDMFASALEDAQAPEEEAEKPLAKAEKKAAAAEEKTVVAAEEKAADTADTESPAEDGE
ncbi:MAG: 30S ribosomal protein S1 [Lentisphaeria bacterium]|nr:30S ribosomal protein S1 [Lentisphaeria bacterium]